MDAQDTATGGARVKQFFLRYLVCELLLWHRWEPIRDAKCSRCGRWKLPPDDPHAMRLFDREVRRAAQLACLPDKKP